MPLRLVRVVDTCSGHSNVIRQFFVSDLAYRKALGGSMSSRTVMAHSRLTSELGCRYLDILRLTPFSLVAWAAYSPCPPLNGLALASRGLFAATLDASTITVLLGQLGGGPTATRFKVAAACSSEKKRDWRRSPRGATIHAYAAAATRNICRGRYPQEPTCVSTSTAIATSALTIIVHS